MKEFLFYATVGGFVAGVAVHSLFDFGWAGVLFLALLGGSAVLLVFLLRERNAALLVAVFLLSAALGGTRYELSEMRAGDAILDAHIGSQVVVTGVIGREPSQRENNQRLVVRTETLVSDAGSTTPRVKVILSAERYPLVAYGDRVHVTGILRKPEPFTTDRGRIFDYPAYLAKDGIYYELRFPRVDILAHGEGNPLIATLLSVKARFIAVIRSAIPEPHASLLAGITLGADDSLGEELTERFRTTGIVHIVVLSGYNITIVADWVTRLFALFLPRLASFGAGALGIVLFAVMTGASATVVRASIMALLVILSRVLGRRYDITRALLLAGVAMVLHNPKILLFDPSFQLSFLATVGLVYISPLFTARFGAVTARFNIRELIATTLATQLLVLPLLLYRGGVFPLYALLVNILVLPVIPLTMGTGFAAGALGMLLPALAMPVGFVAYSLLAYVLFVVDVFSRLPFSGIAIPPFSLLLLVALYVAVAVFVRLLRRKYTTPRRTLEAGGV